MSSRINPPPPAARNFPGTPPLKREVGGWVLAVSSGLFFVVARDAKKMKGETPKQAEKSEKRERQKREKRKRNTKAPREPENT